MSQPDPVHPLQETFARIAQRSEFIRPRLGRPAGGEGWIVPADLFAPQSPSLAALIRATQRRVRTEAPTVTGGVLIQEYQWPLLATAVACFLVDRRVPDLRPENVQLRLPPEESEGEAREQGEQIAFLRGCFVALPDDLAAGRPDALLVPDLDALRAALRTGIETHMAFVIDKISEAVGCKPKGLWLFVTDYLASMLSWIMQKQGQSACLTCIEQEAHALIGGAQSPLNKKKVSFFALTYQGHTHVFLDRASCCYWYKMEGGAYCSTCPHRTKQDRNERLLKHLAEEYA